MTLSAKGQSVSEDLKITIQHDHGHQTRIDHPSLWLLGMGRLLDVLTRR